MRNSAVDQITDYFIQVLAFNDFKTLFLMVVAIFVARPLTQRTYDIAPLIVSSVRSALRIENDESVSDRAILSTTYCLLSFFAGTIVHLKFPGFSLHQKIISAITWPLFAYVLLTIIGLLLTTFFLFPFDLLRIMAAAWRRFSR